MWIYRSDHTKIMWKKSFLEKNMRIVKRYPCTLRCKGTTKNAHTQEKWIFFYENNRFYLFIVILYSSRKLACDDENKVIIIKRSWFYKKKYERSGVWSAFCECSYEGIGVRGRCDFLAKADVRRYNKKCTYARKVNIFFMKIIDSIYL